MILAPTRELAQQIAGDMEDPDVLYAGGQGGLRVRRRQYGQAGPPPGRGLPDRGGHPRPA